MQTESIKLVERPLFIGGLTVNAGFFCAYGYLTHGNQGNGLTGNMMRVGTSLAEGDWPLFFESLIPILSCVLGVMLCEWVRETANHPNGNWHKRVLLIETLALFALGLVPADASDLLVVTLLAGISGFQINSFRVWYGGVHNTTVTSGALRNLGHFCYVALAHRKPEAIKTLLIYICMVFSFALGSGLSVVLCKHYGTRAIWFSAGLTALWFYWVFQDDVDA